MRYDELTELDGDRYSYLLQRPPGNILRVRSASSPGGSGHNWKHQTKADQMKILVLGGKGYIGSAFRERFPDSCPIDLCLYQENKLGALDYDCLTPGEIRVFDAVILLAGHSSVKLCQNDPASWENNVGNFTRLLGKLEPRQRFIYASSVSVYGGASGTVTEETPPVLVGEYDRQKQELDCRARLSGLDYYGLRFGTVCGFSPVFRTDMMINAMVYSAKTYGVVNAYFPWTRRPILWIQDLIRGVVAILESKEPKPGIYNLVSFNSDVGMIGEQVASICGVPCVRPPATSDGGKLVSSDYNFYANPKKFCEAFDYLPRGTISRITYELLEKWERIKTFGKRG